MGKSFVASNAAEIHFGAECDDLLTLDTPIAGAVNNFGPNARDNLFLTANFWQLRLSGIATVSGMQGGVSGRIVTLYNASAFVLTLAQESALSDAANRFNFTVAIPAGGLITVQWIAALARWAQKSSGFAGTTPPPAPVFSGARVTAAANQAVNTTTAAILFDAETFDTDNYWDVGQPTRFTAPAVGTYLVGCTVQGFGAGSSPSIKLRLNGGAILSASFTGPDNTVSGPTATVQMVAGDFVEVTMQTFAACQSLANQAGQGTPNFWIARL